jgi:Transglycosylase-like domain
MRRILIVLGLGMAVFATYQSATGNGQGTPGAAQGLVRPIFGGPPRCLVLYAEDTGTAPSACSRPVPGTPRAESPDAPVPSVCGAQGMDAILATIRTLESGGRYSIGPNAGGASGAYQFIQGTWAAEARAAGRPDLAAIEAYQASPADQDAVARHLVTEALAGSSDVSRVPVVWFVGSDPPPPPGWDAVPAAWAGNRLTPRQYQAKWLEIYGRAGAACA